MVSVLPHHEQADRAFRESMKQAFMKTRVTFPGAVDVRYGLHCVNRSARRQIHRDLVEAVHARARLEWSLPLGALSPGRRLRVGTRSGLGCRVVSERESAGGRDALDELLSEDALLRRVVLPPLLAEVTWRTTEGLGELHWRFDCRDVEYRLGPQDARLRLTLGVSGEA